MKGADPRAVLERDREEARRLAERVGAERVRKLLERSAADLAKRLRAVDRLRGGPGEDSFTAAQVKATLEQVRAVLRPLQVGLGSEVRSASRDAAALAAEGTVRYLRAAERAFRGVVRPLPLREAALLDAASAGADASVLRRLGSDPEHPARAGILARYGVGVVGDFEEVLQRRFLTGAPWEDVKAELVERSPFLQGKPGFWAERIARTETMAAHGRAALESFKEADGDLGDLCKVLSCVVDARTGSDSIAVHGQVRRLSEPFASWNGTFQNPPDRPNDRAVVVPHRLSWGPPPAYLQPLPWGEVVARWAKEGRKGSPPERPPVSTIPPERFVAAPLGEETKPPPPEPEPPPPPAPVPPAATPAARRGIDLGWAESSEIPKRATFAGWDAEGRPLFDRTLAGQVEPERLAPEDWTRHHREAFERWTELPLDADGRFSSADALPDFALSEPLPDDYEKDLSDVLGRVAKELGKRKLSLSELIEAKGETDWAFSPNAAKRIVPPKTLDPERVLERMAEPPGRSSSTEKERKELPIVVKKGGKLWLHEGAEIVAARGADALSIQARVLDLDKLSALGKPIDFATWKKSAGAAMKKVVASGKRDVGAEREVREHVRALLAQHGIATRDDLRVGRQLVSTIDAAGVDPDQLRGKDEVHTAGKQSLRHAFATHGWGGVVTLRTDVAKNAVTGFEKSLDEIRSQNGDRMKQNLLLSNEKRSAAVHAVRTLVHEEIHGASSDLPEAYSGAGVVIEEVATEVLARKVVRDLLGVAPITNETADAIPLGLPRQTTFEGRTQLSWPTSAGSYGHLIENVFRATGEVAGWEKIQERVENAFLETRKWKPAQKWRTGDEQIAAYVDALGLTGAKATELRRRLGELKK